MDHDESTSNDAGNRPFRDVLAARLARAGANRRQVLAGGLAAAAAGFLAGHPARAAAFEDQNDHKRPYRRRAKGLLGFEPVAIADGVGPEVSISADYEYDVLIPWGDPLEPGGPRYVGDPGSRPSARDQAEMIGIGHDGMWFFPYIHHGRASSRSGMLCINHEFGGVAHATGKDAPESLEDVRLLQHAMGLSVVAIANWKGRWRQVRGHHSRRIHVNTPVCFSGPVAIDHPLLQTPNGNVPLGTLNNCAGGHTPWGTYLTCEENFNGYFGASNDRTTWSPSPEQERYGFSDGGFGYGWEQFDRRFDLSDPDYRNEENRFGWVMEVDPFDATRTPVKRTALGRCKHEGAEVTVGAGGRAVVYMGDDERFDYIYKFVSADNWQSMRKRGVSPLDEGTLYVARFDDDGSGEWLPLTADNPTLASFADQESILTYARLAADAVGATPMDRPEWTTIGADGYVYCTLTNNSQRTVPDAPNPLAPNPDGHIIRWKDSDHFTGLKFRWDVFLIAAATHGTEDAFGSPDGLWADPDGRLFIQTDGGQPDGLNDQMLVADTTTGELRRLLTGVSGCEVTGLTVTPDRRTLFANLQHPGDGDPGATNFPAATDGVTIPRDATLVIRRRDGGIVGY